MSKTVVLGEGKQKATNTIAVGKARKEKNAQKRLDAMQVANSKGDVALADSVERAAKEMEFLKKNRHFLATNQIKPVSDYTELGRMYKDNLRLLTEEVLVTESEIKTKRFLESLAGGYTAEQEAVVALYFGRQAKVTFQIVDAVKNILAQMGELKKIEVTEQVPAIVE